MELLCSLVKGFKIKRSLLYCLPNNMMSSSETGSLFSDQSKSASEWPEEMPAGPLKKPVVKPLRKETGLGALEKRKSGKEPDPEKVIPFDDDDFQDF